MLKRIPTRWKTGARTRSKAKIKVKIKVEVKVRVVKVEARALWAMCLGSCLVSRVETSELLGVHRRFSIAAWKFRLLVE